MYFDVYAGVLIVLLLQYSNHNHVLSIIWIMFDFKFLSLAPCIPRNLQTSSECSSDILLSTWDLAEGALRYTVNAYGNKGEDATYSCSSVSNSCAMTGVSCGEYLSIYITASNDECSSPPALGSSPDTGEESFLTSVS